MLYEVSFWIGDRWDVHANFLNLENAKHYIRFYMNVNPHAVDGVITNVETHDLVWSTQDINYDEKDQYYDDWRT